MEPQTSDEHHAVLARLRSLIFGYRASLLLHAVAELRIADALADGPLSCDEIAARTGSQAMPLRRVLRALATYGIFEEREDGRFSLTPTAGLLRSEVEGSLRDSILFATSSWAQLAWNNVVHTLRTGESAFAHVHGTGVYDYLANHPEASEVFSRAMARRSAGEASFVESYDFSRAGVVVDVGGGNGAVLGTVLAAHPHVRGILFELPDVVAGVRARLESMGVVDRCLCESGDFFERVPSGGDTYLLSRVIHNWDDEQAAAILRRCREAIPGQGTLLLVEEVVPPGNDPHPSKLTDVEMLVLASGRERTEAEYRALLFDSGFRLARVLPTRSSVSVIEALPI